ncbi:MAG: DoxX family protein, partial [Bacteroidota bacterium]
LSFPTWLVIPLGIAKLLGLVAIWTKRSSWLKEWAYAGFFFDFLLALTAHLAAKDGGFGAAAMALLFLGVSYYFDGKLFGNAAQKPA